jgi:hypothetical protein
MNDLRRALSAFAAADLEAWDGLPADVRLVDLASLLAFDPADVRRGDAGNPSRTRLWVPAESATYHAGLRLWLDDDGERVVLLEGVHPVDGEGEPVRPPDLGEPDGTLDAVLGPFRVQQAESVYAARGLGVQVYPDTGVLVGVIGFAPTTFEDYRTRLQPHREPTRPFPEGVTR